MTKRKTSAKRSTTGHNVCGHVGRAATSKDLEAAHAASMATPARVRAPPRLAPGEYRAKLIQTLGERAHFVVAPPSPAERDARSGEERPDSAEETEAMRDRIAEVLVLTYGAKIEKIWWREFYADFGIDGLYAINIERLERTARRERTIARNKRPSRTAPK